MFNRIWVAAVWSVAWTTLNLKSIGWSVVWTTLNLKSIGWSVVWTTLNLKSIGKDNQTAVDRLNELTLIKYSADETRCFFRTG
jgi:hypothetical protein